MMAFEGGLKHRVEGAARRNSTVSADSNSVGDDGVAIAKGGVAVPFPWKVHIMLDAVAEEGLDHVVSWQTHGRSFLVHKPKIFVELVMSRYDYYPVRLFVRESSRETVHFVCYKEPFLESVLHCIARHCSLIVLSRTSLTNSIACPSTDSFRRQSTLPFNAS